MRVETMLRFGEQRRVEAFARGCLYMNTLKYFREKEKEDLLRRDRYEGASHMRPGDGAILSIQIDEQFQPVGELFGPAVWTADQNMNINVFCLYALQSSASGEIVIDPRNRSFGDSFAMLLNFQEFMNRVEAAVMATDHTLQVEMVEYIDEANHNGAVGPFKKVSRFSYQNEFRMALYPGNNGDPLSLQVGDLSDIVRIGHMCDLADRLSAEEISEGQRTLRPWALNDAI
jgi:hypothetical protein